MAGISIHSKAEDENKLNFLGCTVSMMRNSDAVISLSELPKMKGCKQMLSFLVISPDRASNSCLIRAVRMCNEFLHTINNVF